MKKSKNINNNIRRQNKNHFLKIAFPFILAIIPIVLIYIYGNILYNHIIELDFFNTTSISVHGIERLNEDDIIAQSGLAVGQNSMNVSIEEIEEKLSMNPWIKSASIKRILPSSFDITIYERKAECWILEKKQIYYADADGNPIAPVKKEKFTSLPLLILNNQNPDTKEAVVGILNEFKKNELPIKVDMISTIKSTEHEGIEITLRNKQLSIYIQPQAWKTNMTYLATVLQDLDNRKELKGIKTIKTFDGNVWISPK